MNDSSALFATSLKTTPNFENDSSVSDAVFTAAVPSAKIGAVTNSEKDFPNSVDFFPNESSFLDNSFKDFPKLSNP